MQFNIVGGTFFKKKNIFVVLAIENHEFLPKKLEFLDKKQVMQAP